MLIKDIKYNLTNGAFVPWQMGTIAVNACDNMKPLKCFSEPICEMEIINQLIKFGDDHETDVTPEIEIPSNHYKKYVHYFLLELCEDTDLAFLPRIHFGQCRYWINGELAFIGNCEDGKHSVAYKCKIKKGLMLLLLNTLHLEFRISKLVLPTMKVYVRWPTATCGLKREIFRSITMRQN